MHNDVFERSRNGLSTRIPSDWMTGEGKDKPCVRPGSDDPCRKPVPTFPAEVNAAVFLWFAVARCDLYFRATVDNSRSNSKRETEKRNKEEKGKRMYQHRTKETMMERKWVAETDRDAGLKKKKGAFVSPYRHRVTWVEVSEENRNPPTITRVSLSLPVNSSQADRERRGKREETWYAWAGLSAAVVRV